MKSFLALLDFKYFLGNKQVWLYAYILVYLVFALTSSIQDPLLALSIIIFAMAPLKPAFLMFVFYLLWEYVTEFSFGITIVLVMQLVMAVKLFIQGKGVFHSETVLQRKVMSMQMVLLLYITIIGLFSFLITQSFTGLSFVFKVFVTFFVISLMHDESATSNVVKSIFHVLMISSMVATVYGFSHETGQDRWISEIGDYVTQFQGTLGTTRMAFFYLVGIAYFLYYVKNVIVRYIGLALFTILILMTVSVTAIILYVAVILIYTYSFGKLGKTLIYLFLVIALVGVSFPIWSNISFVKPIIYRISFSMNAYYNGDVDDAVSGRDNLTYYYLDEFKEGSVANMIFGNSKSAMSVTGADTNSHNTYIDIIYYFGLLGLLLLLFYQIKKIVLIRHQSYFFPLLTLKAILLLGAATVSIMTASFFIFLIFI